MNTNTGNIFQLDGQPLAADEVELTADQFKELFPVRGLEERLRMYRDRFSNSVESESKES